jgi:two-component system, chemotaxis family, protein-glutamate methylesterase/glutaminase
MQDLKYILIGGSAGSFRIVTEILDALPKDYPFTIIFILHRLKHIKSGFVEALLNKSLLPVSEPYDKEAILPKHVYIAPANYHLYIEPDRTFALSSEEQVNHSRPSIDLTFASAGFSLKEKALGILLSGANKDGAAGLRTLEEYGGTIIVQDPLEASVRTMPDAGIEMTNSKKILTSQKIIEFLLNMNQSR